RSTVLCAEGKGEWREVKALDPRNAVSVDLAGVRPGYLPKTGVEQQFAKVPSSGTSCSGGRTLGRCLSIASHPESGKTRQSKNSHNNQLRTKHRELEWTTQLASKYTMSRTEQTQKV
ncbi:hypothetical protein PIB30_106308, partial [Stylosanthes scabra]|nr:hypothetical protein [Stylosanthes scabra]